MDFSSFKLVFFEFFMHNIDIKLSVYIRISIAYMWQPFNADILILGDNFRKN